MVRRTQRFEVVDLFAGAGGLSEGFSQAGGDILLGLDEDKWASETFSANHPDATSLTADLRGMSEKEITASIEGSVDVVVGGPPCQGFSVSKVQSEQSDPRNELLGDFLRIAEALNPQACVIENVPGLLRRKSRNNIPVIEEIEAELRNRGWHSTYKVLRAEKFGVPQFRERLFIVAFANQRLFDSFSWPVPTHDTSSDDEMLGLGGQLAKAVTLWDAISDLPDGTTGNESIPVYRTAPANDFQEMMRIGSGGIYNHEVMRHTARVVERFKEIGFGQSEEDVTSLNAPRERGDATKVSNKRYSQNSRRQRPNEPSNTVVASSHSNFIHPYLHRNFTVRELARFQSFPDSYIFHGKRAVLSKKLSVRKGLLDDVFLDQRSQVGNAVPPILAKSLACSIFEALSAGILKYGEGA